MTRLARTPPERREHDQDPSQEPIRDVELWDLVSSFGRLMRQTLALAPRSIVYDETPIEVYMEEILRLLEHRDRLTFWDLFREQMDRGRIVGRFLAVLELAKAKKIQTLQEDTFGEIWITRAESQPGSESLTGETDKSLIAPGT